MTVTGNTQAGTGKNGQDAGQVPESVTTLQDELRAQYKARIDGLEQENNRLWREVEAKQNTIDNLTRMLPAPKSTGGDQTRRAAPLWLWLTLTGAILAAGIGGYWLWLTW